MFQDLLFPSLDLVLGVFTFLPNVEYLANIIYPISWHSDILFVLLNE